MTDTLGGQPQSAIYPQQDGDLYWVVGYPVSGMSGFGVAVMGNDRLRPGYGIWTLATDDGDYNEWEREEELPNMPCDEVKLVRRMADVKAEALREMGVWR